MDIINKLDEFNEIDEKTKKILYKMNNVSKKIIIDKKIIIKNIQKLSNALDDNFILEKDLDFQQLLRIQNQLINKNIRLVGIDISRTIIEYKSTTKTQLKAAKIIKDKYKDIFENYQPEKIIKEFAKGFKKYNNYRKITKKELNEVYVYNKYILKKLTKNNIISDEIIKDIIKIWMENSVQLKKNSKKISEIINELKKRNIIVVSISDMLGEMSKYALKKFDLYTLFDAHFCSNDFGYRKAKKKRSLYTYINKHYKLKPSNCLMIGNDIKDDIKSSNYNGWYSIFITYEKKEINNKLNILNIEKLDELLSLLTKDKIKKLPVLEDKLNVINNKAVRDNDINDYIKSSYYIRQSSKKIANRCLREHIYKKYLIQSCGKNTRLGNNIEIRNPFKIIIGSNCQINDNFTVLNENYVFIGNNVMIANNVFISTYYHSWKKGMLEDDVECWKKGDTKTSCVSIEKNCWIGPNCSFESNVYLGNNCVVCANTLVKSGVYPPYSLIGGNPCRIIKNIENDLKIESKVIPFE